MPALWHNYCLYPGLPQNGSHSSDRRWENRILIKKPGRLVMNDVESNKDCDSCLMLIHMAMLIFNTLF